MNVKQKQEIYKLIEQAYTCINEIHIVVAGLRDLKVSNLAESLHATNNNLTDAVESIDTAVMKEEKSCWEL